MLNYLRQDVVMTKKAVIWANLVMLIIAVVLAAGGCRAESVTPPVMPPDDPFAISIGIGEKQVVTFSGNSAGHVAGEVSEFTLEMDNRPADLEERWQGAYCVLLLDRDGVVMEITHQQLIFQPG